MLSYLLKTTLCWAMFYLLYHLWLGKETFFKINRWYLLATVLLGLLVPAIDFQWIMPVHEEPAIMHYMQPITVGVEQLETVIITVSATEEGYNWWGLLIKIYWLGVAIAFGRFVYGLFKINKLFNDGEKIRFAKYLFISTPSHHVPFSFFKNLFWSKQFEVDEEDKQNILRHEEAHIFQWHSVDIILLEILGVLFWCSPFIYLYKKAIKTTHEYLADDYVVAQSGRKKYGHLLLRQSQHKMPIAISNSLFSSQLKKRIVMMTKNKSNKLASLKYLAVLPLLALLFLAFSFEQKPIETQELIHPILKAKMATDTLPGGEVFKVVEDMPVFSGCAEIADKLKQKKCSDEKMMQFIFANLKYPKEAQKDNVQGMVVISFIVENDGSISNAKAVRSIGGGCDEEALRVVNTMPKWTPGKQRGKEVRVQYNLPIRFKLDDESPKSDEATKKAIPGSADGEIFKVVEEMPRFPGCEELTDASEQTSCSQKKMLEFIYNNIKYPKEAKAKGIEGMAVVQFVVEKDGSIADAEIIRSIGGGCDEEVLKVVYMMPNWIPGEQGGKVVRTQFNLPVKFKLEGGSKNTDGEVDQMPRFMACDGEANWEQQQECSLRGLFNYITENLKYPELAKKNGIEGKVVIKFTVAADGSIQEAQAVKGIGGGCEEEALRLMKSMPNWVPGVKDGKPAAVEMTLPFLFALPEKSAVGKMEIGKDIEVAEDKRTVWNIFPNPATDKLSMEITLGEGSYKLAMTDINGRVIHVKKIEGSGGRTVNIIDLPLKDVPRGTLHITITDEKGKVVNSASVVLQ